MKLLKNIEDFLLKKVVDVKLIKKPNKEIPDNIYKKWITNLPLNKKEKYIDLNALWKDYIK